MSTPGRLSRLPRLTGTGVSAALGGAGLLAAGLVSGYPSLAGLGAAGLALVLAAAALVAMPARIAVDRQVSPDRVAVGAGATGRLRVRNTGRLPAGRFEAIDPVDAVDGGPASPPLRLSVPALGRRSAVYLEYPVATGRRGLLRLGPMLLQRRDPLGLARRGAQLAGPAWLWVHPRVHPVKPLPVGVVLDFEGRLTDRAPRGSTAFSSLREYRAGDDPRQIHWRSTARLGTLVVQERVDTTEPAAAIVLDTRAAVLDADEFEHAVEVAASLVSATHRAGQAVTLAVLGETWPDRGATAEPDRGATAEPDRGATAEPTPGAAGRAQAGPAGRRTPMDRLAAARRTHGPAAGQPGDGRHSTAALLGLTRKATTGGSLVVVTGLDAAVVPRLSAERRRFSRVVVVQLAGPARAVPQAAPTVTGRAGLAVVRAATAAEAAAAFTRLAGGRP